MGADCCGGGTEAAPAAPEVAGLSLSDRKPATAKQGAANGTKPAKSHAECVAELQGFIQKRIQLFEEYAKREADAVRPWLTQHKTSDDGNNKGFVVASQAKPKSFRVPCCSRPKPHSGYIFRTLLAVW